MSKDIVFRPSNTFQSVEVYEPATYTESGWAMVGHIPLSLALSMHPSWRWMTDTEYASKEVERVKRHKAESKASIKCASARCNGSCGYDPY